jgi:hypothetical protein
MRVQFTDQSFTSSAKGVTEWAWDFDGDDIVDSTLQNPQFTYIASGWEQKFTVTLTVKDGVHAASKVRKQDFVLLNPFPDARAEIFGSGSTSRPLPSPLVMPSFSYTYSALGTRGYWFEVPSTMRLTGFQVPNEGSAPQMAAWIVQLPAAPSGSVPITAKGDPLPRAQPAQRQRPRVCPADPDPGRHLGRRPGRSAWHRLAHDAQLLWQRRLHELHPRSP